MIDRIDLALLFVSTLFGPTEEGALRIQCEACGATRGQPCTSRLGLPMKVPHLRRWPDPTTWVPR